MKKVIIDNKHIFNSVSEAADFLGIKPASVSAALRQKYNVNFGGTRVPIRYFDDEVPAIPAAKPKPMLAGMEGHLTARTKSGELKKPTNAELSEICTDILKVWMKINDLVERKG